MKIITCDCGVKFIYLRHYIKNSVNPVELAPAQNGNLVLNKPKGVYRFATKDEIERARREGKQLYISHFVNCKFAPAFRKAA